MVGDPYGGGCKPKSQCYSNSECSSDTVCKNGQCKDPCDGYCVPYTVDPTRNEVVFDRPPDVSAGAVVHLRYLPAG